MNTRIPVAIQLYSLRDVAPNDLAGTLQKVAAMGYQGVEMAGYYNLSGRALRELLDHAGLRVAGAHTGLESLEGEAFENTVAINRELGNDRLIVPGADLSDLPRLLDRLNAAHRRARACGMRAGFHNHTDEFKEVGGKTILEHIFSSTPDDFLVQLDIGWATAARQDVPAFLRRYARRIESVHVKEYHPTLKTAAVGEGTVNWPALFDVLEQETAVKWYVVEQEAYAVGPLESAKTCIDNLRKMGR